MSAFAAELLKIRTSPAAWIAFASSLGIDVALGLLTRAGGTVSLGDGWPLTAAHPFVAIAVFAAGDEYRAGQLGVSLAAVPRRTRFLGAKLAATVAVAGPAAVLAVLPGGLLRADGTVVPRVVGYLLLSLVGFGFAVVTRSVVTPLVVLVVAAVLVPPVLGGILPTRFLPYEAALSLLTPDRGVGAAVVVGWAVASVAAAWVCVVRRDGGGR